MDLFEKTLEDTLIHKGKVIEYRILTVELPDGNATTRDVIRHPGGVAILAFKDEETILLVEQFRKPLDIVTLELPAGKIEKGEDTKICAIRELEEETGYKAENFDYVGKVAVSPGFCDEYIYIYKATGLYQGTAGGDDDEFINVKEVKIKDLKTMIQNGELEDGKTLSAFMMVL
ncbi:MAG: NUDIX hydrolase [Clostridiaceae bacterium]